MCTGNPNTTPGDDTQRVVVQTGLRDEYNTEILSGLEPGEVISLGASTSSNTSTTPATGDHLEYGIHVAVVLGFEFFEELFCRGQSDTFEKQS